MQQALKATFMRGGTSKAVMFTASDLPEDRADWAPIFSALMGSPDENGRQLDGMGGGVSSLSKVCVVGPSSRHDADVDYTFAQIAIGSPGVDYSANCGNMSSAIGPYAVDEGLVQAPSGTDAVVRIHNTNTGKIIVSHFPMEGSKAAVDGDFSIDGVAGTAAAIRLDFLDPGGAGTGRLLPTGNVVDVVDVSGVGPVEVSMVDASNPCVFVEASSLGMTGTEHPGELDANPVLLEQLDSIRIQASIAMGISSDAAQAAVIAAIPKVAMVAPATPSKTLSGKHLSGGDVDILVRMISEGVPHRAVPITGGLCLAAASRIPGSVANRILTAEAKTGDLRIGHPSGVLRVSADVQETTGGIQVRSATVYRTARRLFQGEVLYRPAAS